MHLDAIKARRLGILRRCLEPRHNPRQLVITQFPRHHIRLLPLRSVHFVIGDRNRTRRHRLRAIVQERMTSPSPVPDLQKNPSARAMHRVRHRFPPRHLRRVVNPRLRVERRIPLHRHGRLGNDQPRRGPLRVILRHQRPRHMPRLRPTAGEGSHEQTIGHFHRAHAQRFEKRKQRIHHSRYYRRPAVLKSPI